MKCKLCENTDDANRFECNMKGWKLVEIYGQQGNKYGAFCPDETPDKIMPAIKELLVAASKKAK